MFYHNFKYSLKILLKNKMLIFWTILFPIILGTLFNMAFSDIEKKEKLDIIDIAIVNDEKFENKIIFKEVFKKLSSDSNKNKLFNIKYVSLDSAKNLLDDGKITGYLFFDDLPNIVVKSNGINETVLKSVTDEIIQTEVVINNIIKEEMVSFSSENISDIYSNLYSDILNMMQNSSVNIIDKSSTNLSYTMIEFYTLIAMACLYGSILGMVSVNQNLANMSNSGKRIAVSPSRKGNIILGSVLASYIVQLVGIFLLFLYTIFVLNVDYGNNLPLIVILALTGSLAGLAIGIFVACIFKTSDNLKTGIIISFTMFGCFLSGMMGVTMKYMIDKNFPIINKLNPASMITDGFYALYYYDTLDRYFFDLASLFVFSLVLIIVSIFSLRRQQYDNI